MTTATDRGEDPGKAQMTEPANEGFRAVDVSLHDVDDKAHTVCVEYPILIDKYRSDFGPGAFSEGWRRRLPMMDVDHGVTKVGTAVRAQSLPDRHQLVGKFDESEPGRRAFEDVRDSTFPGWSFHYVGGEAVPHPSGRRSTFRFVRAVMRSFGPVWSPAIPGAGVVGLRSLAVDPFQAAQAQEVLARIDCRHRMRRFAGVDPASTRRLLEQAEFRGRHDRPFRGTPLEDDRLIDQGQDASLALQRLRNRGK